MHCLLQLHPDFRSTRRIDVEVVRSQEGLTLTYRLAPVAGVVIPGKGSGVRRDALWEHTCFEAFLRAGLSEGYLEFNFSPSTDWAIYHLNAYRRGLRAAEAITPMLEVRQDDDALEVRARVSLAGVTELAAETAWQLGLCAVIEETGGAKSYWALAHPPGKPDFHHADCFALMLPAPSRP